ncbi:MAG: DUF5011 domain-containing protein [Candidatus Hydrogenedens sp.]|nr:DUF5011 domain-containing protein [Candidatus Hydrogenedens sp.]
MMKMNYLRETLRRGITPLALGLLLLVAGCTIQSGLLITVLTARLSEDTVRFTAVITALDGSNVVYEDDKLFREGETEEPEDTCIAAVDWDFGDGTTGSGRSVTHTYAAPGTYTVTTTVTTCDGKQVTHTIAASVGTLTPTNNPPVADAGPAQQVIRGVAVTLDGSGSFDPDGDAITYAWTVASTPEGANVVLSSSTIQGPGFTPTLLGDYTFSLVVNDGEYDSLPDTVTITVVNQIPVADAGPDQNIEASAPPKGEVAVDTIVLDGTGSYDLDGDPLTYAWQFVSVPGGGTPPALTQGTTSGPSFQPGALGVYELQLVVNDGFDDSAPDNVVITYSYFEPVITGDGGGANNATYVVECGEPFSPGIVAIDVFGNDITDQLVVSGGPVDTGVPGTYTLMYDVTDSFGNSARPFVVTVTVQDTTAPEAITQNITLALDANGTVSIVPADVDGGSNDNCAFTLAVTPDTFDCGDLGDNTVTLTITDGVGLTDSADAVVTIFDNLAPVMQTQDITVALDANGNATITAEQVDNGSTDNCDITLNVDPAAFDCSNLGENTVTLTGTDSSGNAATATATVTVVDNLAPVMQTQDITVVLDANGNAAITAEDVDNGSADNCDITLSVTPDTFDCGNLGENTVTLTGTDSSGNSATATATVTVTDTLAPVMVAQNITVFLDANGEASITAEQVDNGSADNCDITLSVEPAAFDCGDIGVNGVVLTGTDSSGNSATTTATVTVLDNIDPTVAASGFVAQLNAQGTVTISLADLAATGDDNCGSSLTAAPLSFDCGDVGPNTVIVTNTDPSGNTATTAVTVTVVDAIAPVALAQNFTVQLDENGEAGISVTDIDNGSSDNCSVTLSVSPSSFTCVNRGNNTVTLTATDASGNTSTATARVTVQDTIAPVALAQDITVALNAQGTATITADQVNNGSSDNCSVTVSVLPDTFDCSNVGANTVTLTATDPSGNTATTTATVTVVDNIAPTVLAQGLSVVLDEQGLATITLDDLNAEGDDNCGTSLSATPLSFDCGDIGDNAVTVTNTDPSGNTASITVTVTVEDTLAPVAVAQNITVQLDASGAASITAADVDNGSNDNCEVELSVSPSTFSCNDVGEVEVTLTATDPSGNQGTATATVTVEDNIAPTAAAQDITVQLDANGNATITGEQVDDGSSDNCSVSLSVTPNTFDCSNVGANTVTLTATDPSGNSDTATATVTVEDTVDPTVSAQDFTAQLDAQGTVTISLADLNASGDDNCGTSLSAEPLSFTCSDIGPNTVTVTNTDPSGNTAAIDVTVTVEDNIAPNAVAQDITVQLDANGMASIVAADVDNGSSDNCSVVLSVSPDTFNCDDIVLQKGVLPSGVEVTLTATDPSGNTDTAIAMVTVEDLIAPTVVAQDITVQLDANGQAFITGDDVDNGSSDNCEVFLNVFPSAFDCGDVGAPVEVTLSGFDLSGNTGDDTAFVTVEDNIDPTVQAQDFTAELDASGEVTVTLLDIAATGDDNCGSNISAEPLVFTCDDIGPNTVTVTNTDPSGNTATTTVTVTVQDSIAPTAIAKDASVELDANGAASIVAADVDDGSSDNCEVILSVSPDTFNCDDAIIFKGQNPMVPVTLTAMDPSGNMATAVAMVTVSDLIAPDVIAQDITVELDANGSATIVAADVDDGSNDNCDVLLSVFPDTFDCSDIGTPVEVTLTGFDPSGNSDSDTAFVTVVDNLPPTIDVDQTPIVLSCGDQFERPPAQGEDNCGGELFVDVTDNVDENTPGIYQVTYEATDPSGNVTTIIVEVVVAGTCDFSCLDAALPPGSPAFCFDFEADSEGFVLDNSSNGLWGRTDLCAALDANNGGAFVLYFGDTATCTYDNGFATTGTATSPAIDLTGATGSLVLTFEYYIQTEGSFGSRDESALLISTDGVNFNDVLATTAAEVSNLFCDDAFTSGGEGEGAGEGQGATPQWSTAVLNLSPYAGQVINLQFFFDSIDDTDNAFTGFAVDNICIYDYSSAK